MVAIPSFILASSNSVPLGSGATNPEGGVENSLKSARMTSWFVTETVRSVGTNPAASDVGKYTVTLTEDVGVEGFVVSEFNSDPLGGVAGVAVLEGGVDGLVVVFGVPHPTTKSERMRNSDMARVKPRCLLKFIN